MRLRRKLGILALVALAASALVLVAAQLVLWSDLPRRMVLDELRQALGMDVQAQVVRTSWRGRTRIDGLTLTLPLADAPFVEAPRVEVRHTGPIALVLGRSLQLHTVTLRGPRVAVNQSPDGGWNVALAAQLLQGAGSDEPTTGAIRLPRIDIRDATVHLTPADRDTVEVSDITISGRPRGGVTYEVELTAPQVGTLRGRFGLPTPTPHLAEFDLKPDPALLAAIADVEPPAHPVQLAGVWEGQLAHDRFAGLLTLTRFQASPGRLSGRMHVTLQLSTGEWSMEPQRMMLESVGLSQPLRLIGGRLRINDHMARGDGLELRGYDGAATLDGELDWRELRGRIDARWQAIQVPVGWRHHGRIRVQLDDGPPGLKAITGSLEHELVSTFGRWQVAGHIDAQAASLENGLVTATLESVRFTRRGQTFSMPGVIARLAAEGTTLNLIELALLESVAGRRLAGSGRIDRREHEWSLQLSGAGLPVPLPRLVLDSFAVRAVGDLERFTLEELSAHAGGVRTSAGGSYDASREEPLNLDVTLTQDAGGAQAMGGLIHSENLLASLRMRGTVRPLKLAATGRLSAQRLRLREADLGDVAAELNVQADREAIAAQAVGIESFGGLIQLNTRVDLRGQRLRMGLAAERIQLAIAQRFNPDWSGLSGTVDLELQGEAPLNDLSSFTATGTFTATEPARGTLVADRITGRISTNADRLRLHDVDAHRATGHAQATLNIPLVTDGAWQLEATAENWPWPIHPAQGVAALLDGEVQLRIRPQGGHIHGPGQIAARVESQHGLLADIQAGLRFEGDHLEVRNLAGDALGGPVSGAGRIHLRNPLASTATVELSGIDLGRALRWHRLLEPLDGRMAVQLSVQHDTGRRARAPARVELTVTFDDTAFGQLGLYDTYGVLHVDANRAVLELLRLRSSAGTVHLSGRATQRGDDTFAFLALTLTDVDLEPLTMTFLPERPPILGLVNGEARLHAQADDWQTAAGRGSLSLRNSDLASLPIFTALFDLMNLRLDTRHPQGQGQAAFRIEDGVFIFDRIAYSNRGLYAQIFGRVEDIWAGGNSPVLGSALLSLRPLPDIALFEPINVFFATLQADVTSVEISGTLDAPQTRTVPLRNLREGLSRLLTGRGIARPSAEAPDHDASDADAAPAGPVDAP